MCRFFYFRIRRINLLSCVRPWGNSGNWSPGWREGGACICPSPGHTCLPAAAHGWLHRATHQRRGDAGAPRTRVQLILAMQPMCGGSDHQGPPSHTASVPVILSPASLGSAATGAPGTRGGAGAQAGGGPCQVSGIWIPRWWGPHDPSRERRQGQDVHPITGRQWPWGQGSRRAPGMSSPQNLGRPSNREETAGAPKARWAHGQIYSRICDLAGTRQGLNC